MLAEIWNFIKLGFWKRFMIRAIAVCVFTLFAKFPNLFIKLCAFIVFFAASGILMPTIVSQFSSQVRSLRFHKRRTTRDMPEELIQLQERMGVRIEEFATLPGKVAYMKGKCVVLGEEYLESLSSNQLKSIFAHELAHIRGRHILFRSIAAIGLVLVPICGWWTISSPIFLSELLTNIIVQVMVTIAVIAFITTAMIPVNWKLEARADSVAAEFVGEHEMESALLNITDEKNHKMASETHPPISERVRLIRKLKG